MNAEMILQEAHAMQEDTVASRRYLHEHPGTGFDTKEALS
jgi:metal-dependent amidase/aminoacylase/carboxypeptidase family protein